MYILRWLLFWRLSILPGSIVHLYTAPSFSVLPETPTLLTPLLWTPGLEQRELYSSIPVNCRKDRNVTLHREGCCLGEPAGDYLLVPSGEPIELSGVSSYPSLLPSL